MNSCPPQIFSFTHISQSCNPNAAKLMYKIQPILCEIIWDPSRQEVLYKCKNLSSDIGPFLSCYLVQEFGVYFNSHCNMDKK